jgi:uncharacterized protein YbjT (DUF2867 family)
LFHPNRRVKALRSSHKVCIQWLLLSYQNILCRHENETYGITGQEPLSYSEAAEILSKEIGKKVFHLDIPEEDTRKEMKEIGMEDWFIVAAMAGFNCIIRGGYASQNDYCS